MMRSRTARRGMTVFGAGVALVLGAALAGCKPPQYGTEEEPGVDTAQAGTATLVLMNQRQEDPGDLVFLLYGPAVQDIENVTPTISLPAVGYGKMGSFPVKAGRWKVAYRLESGDLRPMPPKADEATDSEWPVVVMAKGKTYTLLIETNDGGLTVWRSNLPLED